jgi:hypothetical protein
MRIFLIGVMIVLLTLSASAQGMFGGGGKRHQGQKSEEQPKKPKENLPVLTPVPNNQPVGKFDPWQNVRGTDPGKTGKNPL